MSQPPDNGNESKNTDLSQIIFRSPESVEKYFQAQSDQSDPYIFLERYHQAGKKFIQTALKNDQTIHQKIEEYKLSLPKEVEEERKNIRVLIILGSKVKTNPKELVINNEYFTISLFLRHIFKYVYNIPEKNILVTTSNKDNISENDSDISCKISPTRSPIKDPGSNDNQKASKENQSESNEKTPKPIFTEEQLKDLLGKPIFRDDIDRSVQGIHFAQVSNYEYRFFVNPSYNKIIKPFNRFFLKALNVNQDSTLFVFFLDHGQSGNFVNIDYQFFVERLNELNAKKYIIFNECCHSGSLIELIRISEKLSSIFPFFTHDEIKDIFNELLHISQYIQKINSPTEDDNKTQNKKNRYHTNTPTNRAKNILSRFN